MGTTIHHGTKARRIGFFGAPDPVTASVIFCLFLGCAAPVTYAKDAGIVITVRNPLKIDRQSEPVVLRWNDLARMYPPPDPARIQIIEQKTQKEMIHQIIDADHNGTPEELVFQSDFKAGEIKKFILKHRREFPRRCSAHRCGSCFPRRPRMGNDRIAFRIYVLRLPRM